MRIGHRKEIRKLTYRALALRRSESFTFELTRANARNVSFRIPLRWPIHIINSVDTRLSCNTPHRRRTTGSLETYPLYSFDKSSLISEEHRGEKHVQGMMQTQKVWKNENIYVVDPQLSKGGVSSVFIRLCKQKSVLFL